MKAPQLETEVKIVCRDRNGVIQKFRDAGFVLVVTQPRHFEDNRLLDTARGDLRDRGAALRIRLAEGKTVLTYKGLLPESDDDELKIREEIETTVARADQILLLFERLGYKPSFRYQKYRTTYRMTHPARKIELSVMFDETPIGDFVELEGAGEGIHAALAVLDPPEEDILTETYVALHQNRRREAGEPPADMVFPEAGAHRA